MRLGYSVWSWLLIELRQELKHYNDANADSQDSSDLPGLEAPDSFEESGFNVAKRAVDWLDRRTSPVIGGGNSISNKRKRVSEGVVDDLQFSKK